MKMNGKRGGASGYDNVGEDDDINDGVSDDCLHVVQ